MFMILILILVVRHELSYATSMEFSGVVTNIVWKSENHNLPLFELRIEDGSLLSISHHSIILNAENIKIGDDVVKTKGNRFCMINGIKATFSRF